MYAQLVFTTGIALIGFNCLQGREFRIAWMAPTKEYYNFSAGSNVGGLKLALENIARDPDLLPGHTIRCV